MTDLAGLSPSAFKDLLVGEGIHRFSLVWDEERGEVRASYPRLDPLARLLGEDRRDFDRHEGFFVQVAPDTGVLQGASVHRTCRGQAAGGVRFWRYDTVEEYLRDGLRLARGMTHKNALAGLWWGGGKGVMAMGTGQDESEPGGPQADLRGVRGVHDVSSRLLRHRGGRRHLGRGHGRDLLADALHDLHPARARRAAATPRPPPRGVSCGAWRPPSASSGWET